MEKTKEKEKEKVKSDIAPAKAAEVSVPNKVEIVPDVMEGQPLVPQDFKSKLSRQQIDVIKEQYAKGATDVELQMFLYVCQRTGLDPFSKQIHMVPRWDSKTGKEVRGVVIGIDGLRSTAERTGAYAGNSDPAFDEFKEIEVKRSDYKTKAETKKKYIVPSRATVTVRKVVQGVLCDFTASAEWDEYYPGDKGGTMWVKMPKNMLGKCAEAKALRKAFPAVMSGLYVSEEMQQASESQMVGTAPRSEGDYDKASRMIAGIKDVTGLQSLKTKIKSSKKYTEDEKFNLTKLIDGQVKKITGIEGQEIL